MFTAKEKKLLKFFNISPRYWQTKMDAFHSAAVQLVADNFPVNDIHAKNYVNSLKACLKAPARFGAAGLDQYIDIPGDTVSGFSQVVDTYKDIRLDAWSKEQIEAEPQFWQAGPDFVQQHGGPITKRFLEAAKQSGMMKDDPHWILDSRVHMLMPGMYPCIPGWHHDNVDRITQDAQPNYFSPRYRAHHIMAIVGGASRTEFAAGSWELEVPETGNLYEAWHPQIDKLLEGGSLLKFTVKPGQLVSFDDRAWHQGTPATEFGWRWFGRLTFSNGFLIPQNKIRTQTQVYLTSPFKGW